MGHDYTNLHQDVVVNHNHPIMNYDPMVEINFDEKIQFFIIAPDLD
jgi:hypothetical protein